MRHETTTAPLPEPRANGAGAARPIRDLIDKYVQIQGGNYDFSLAIEYSIDEGATFHELVAATASAVAPTEFPQPATHIYHRRPTPSQRRRFQRPSACS